MYPVSASSRMPASTNAPVRPRRHRSNRSRASGYQNATRTCRRPRPRRTRKSVVQFKSNGPLGRKASCPTAARTAAGSRGTAARRAGASTARRRPSPVPSRNFYCARPLRDRHVRLPRREAAEGEVGRAGAAVQREPSVSLASHGILSPLCTRSARLVQIPRQVRLRSLLAAQPPMRARLRKIATEQRPTEGRAERVRPRGLRRARRRATTSDSILQEQTARRTTTETS